MAHFGVGGPAVQRSSGPAVQRSSGPAVQPSSRPATPSGSLMHRLALTLAACATVALSSPGLAQASGPLFSFQEVMVPVRDGAHLQTVIMRPSGHTEPLPILFRRTPYGVPASAPPTEGTVPVAWRELMADGYIIVIQNLRGRFKSEGTFLLSSAVNLADKSPNNVNETTDAYDSIDWLVKNVPNNNGKVGMYGVS